MKTFFTSDTHYGHANIIKYCNRPFSSIEEMDQKMIDAWNKKVTNDDVVYHLGDFAFYPPEKIFEIVRKLKGTIYVIPGNHDKPLRKAKLKYGAQLELDILDPLIAKTFTTDDQEVKVIMCHYAMRVWDQSHFGSFHLYGHSHGTLPEDNSVRAMDVGVDTNYFSPWELDEIMVKMYRRSFIPVNKRK